MAAISIVSPVQPPDQVSSPFYVEANWDLDGSRRRDGNPQVTLSVTPAGSYTISGTNPVDASVDEGAAYWSVSGPAGQVTVTASLSGVSGGDPSPASATFTVQPPGVTFNPGGGGAGPALNNQAALAGLTGEALATARSKAATVPGAAAADTKILVVTGGCPATTARMFAIVHVTHVLHDGLNKQIFDTAKVAVDNGQWAVLLPARYKDPAKHLIVQVTAYDANDTFLFTNRAPVAAVATEVPALPFGAV